MPALADYQNFFRYVQSDDVGDVKVVTLRRPEALNALSDEVTDEILALIRRWEGTDAVRGFVLTGYGPRAFCAGADIGRFPAVLGNAAAAAQYARDCARLLTHIDAMRKPVVAALNGMALGGGLELALRCHGIVALIRRRPAISGDHAGHRARAWRDGGALSQVAECSSSLPRHDPSGRAHAR